MISLKFSMEYPEIENKWLAIDIDSRQMSTFTWESKRLWVSHYVFGCTMQINKKIEKSFPKFLIPRQKLVCVGGWHVISSGLTFQMIAQFAFGKLIFTQVIKSMKIWVSKCLPVVVVMAAVDVAVDVLVGYWHCYLVNCQKAPWPPDRRIFNVFWGTTWFIHLNH